MSDALELLVGTKVKWTGDRITQLSAIQPRHIGRVISFEFFVDPNNLDNYTSKSVMGALAGYSGDSLSVDGIDYRFDSVANVKIWRREAA